MITARIGLFLRARQKKPFRLENMSATVYTIIKQCKKYEKF